MTPIETERAVLRPVRSDDIKALGETLSDSDVRTSYALFSEKYFNAGTVEGFVRLREAFNKQEKGLMCALCLKGEDRAIGYVGLRETDPVNRPNQWELGYFLDKAHHGKGLVSEVVPALLAYAQEFYDVDAFFAGVKEGNEPSNKILIRNGFTVTGVDKNWAQLIIEPDGTSYPDEESTLPMIVYERYLGA